MTSKRGSSKETVERSTGEVVERTSVDFPLYAYTQLFIEKGTTLTWKQMKDTF